MTESTNFDINAVIETAKKVVTQPKEFYDNMPKSGGYTNPLIFAVVMGAASGILAMIFSFFSNTHFGSMSFGIISIIVMPIVAIIVSFVGGGIMFVIWKLMGSSENYETAFRCVAFSTVIYPVIPIAALIPYLGTLMFNGWWFFLMFLASIGVHGIEKQKSMIVIGIIGLVMVLMSLSSERGQRHFEARYGDFNEQMGELQNMSPEEMGEAAGKLLKGLQEGLQENEN